MRVREGGARGAPEAGGPAGAQGGGTWLSQGCLGVRGRAALCVRVCTRVCVRVSVNDGM